MSTIDSFSGQWRPLSNFFPCSVILYEDEPVYPSTEHAYQAAKTFDKFDRETIRLADTPGKAKRLGGKVKLRSDWEQTKDALMLYLLRQKFRNPNMAKWLLATGDAKLIEGNTWGDTYWGVCNGEGKNMLGILLMQVRSEIKNAL